MGTIRIILLMMVIGSARPALSQVISTLSPAPAQESFFLYEVKLIEEFIERFNDDSDSYVRTQSRAMLGTDSMINRRRMVRSLFDRRRPWTADTAAFIAQVVTAPEPHFLDFTDTNWYAEVATTFTCGGKQQPVILLLHMARENGGVKWMIAGMSSFNCGTPAAITLTGTPDYISTSAYGTNFVVFHQVFTKGMHAASYFEPTVIASPRGQAFISAVQQGRATLQRIGTIRYHFFSIPGWQFSVDQIKRKETNTGWLITSLQPLPLADLHRALQQLLFR
ncbi:MAG: hypothetical protein JNM41_04785 [Flavipsychrobacter sp.]|nr:hypothetical protein [Flavipsychrobacter sp.]